MSLSPPPLCLVVDDEEAIRLLLTDFLSDKGYLIYEARNRKTAAELLAEREFDLVLVDKNLSDGSGMEVAAEVRHLGHQSEIIIITGYSDLDSAIEAFRFGVFRYIKKPFDLNKLSVEVAGALQTNALKKHLRRRTEELEIANAHLLKSETKFRELAELLPGIVIETDPIGVPNFVNRTGLESTGYDYDAFRSVFSDATIVVEEDQERWIEDVNRALAGESVSVAEYLVRRKDDTKMPVLMKVAPLAESQSPRGLRALLLDITPRKKAEEALREKEAELQLVQKMDAIGSLAGGVAHDFNNMLSIIRGYCDVIRMELGEEMTFRDDVENIIDAADRAADLTRQLLAFGRKQILVPQTFNLNESIAGMRKMIRRLVREDISVDIRLHSKPLFIHVDKSQIDQLVMNLVVNARDAMPDGGSLVIETALGETEAATPSAVLTVRDNGTGMDEDTVSRIFEPFFTTKPKGKGTGLGLATVYGIVQQSDGTISVESEAGEGSRFEICIPLADEAHDRESVPPAEDEKLAGQETILVVEDEIVLLEVVAKILRNYGYSVLTAPHSGDALLICEEHKKPIDLLLVDVVMPRLNGPELAERLCRKRSEMRVLFVSGYSDFTVVRHVVAANADNFLAKPFSARDLAVKVREVLDRKSE